jgi:phage terminase large subunit
MPRLLPLKASAFKRLSEAEQQAIMSEGAVVVNDVFFPHFRSQPDIKLPHGGYGSGKSIVTAMEYIVDCLNLPYFRLFYGRKDFIDVRNSCFDTLCDLIEERGLQRYFKYSRADNSSMVIRCLLNGNIMKPFGSNDAKSMKSIKDPTHIWFEEADQYSEDDFSLMFSRLRTEKAHTQITLTFNTGPVLPGHWILKLFFPWLVPEAERPKFDLLAGLNIERIFCNYTDNYFIDQDKYLQKLKLISGGNQFLLDAMARGAWGVIENANPWLYNFSREKHDKRLPFLPSFPVYLTFDFNKNPFVCTCWQMSPTKGTSSSFLHAIREINEVSDKINVDAMCKRIKAAFPASILYVTGDRNGNNEETGAKRSIYKAIQSALGLSDKQMNTNTSNLEHADSRILCNTMFGSYPNLYIDSEKCPVLFRQCQQAEVDMETSKPSQLLKDRGRHKNDEFDSMRYLFQTYFKDYVDKLLLPPKK